MASMNGDAASQGQYKAEQNNASAAPSNNTSATTPQPSKDEIGWYFCEQYYITLSKNPDKLHLFFNKKSQFVHGPEAEILSVSVGRVSIQERIKLLAFNDTKVRISNVDTQESSEGLIVIQVIGETANTGKEPKKFVQTFILAPQASGYYVLNSIFRTLTEEENEEETSTEAVEDSSATTHTLQASLTPPTTDNEVPVEADVSEQKQAIATPVEEPLAVAQVDEKLEQAIESVTKPADQEEPATNGVEASEGKAEAAEAVEVPIAAEETPSVEAETKTVEPEVEAEKPEVPQDPVPTPAETKSTPVEAPAPAPVAKPSAPAAPAAPAKPMSWANRAAAAAASAPKPAVPQVKPVVPATQPRAAPATKSPATAPAAQQPAPNQASPAQTTQATPATENKENDEPKSEGWQSVGENTKKQGRAAPAVAPQVQDKDGCLGYLRNVIESVQADELKSVMSKFGKVSYLDINRAKNCGFIEFEEPAGYQAAFKANPIKVGEIDVYIESRRPKQAGFSGPQPFNRGGMNQRGRGNFQQPGQRGRGDFNNNANRGRGGARGGRGGAGQPVAAS